MEKRMLNEAEGYELLEKYGIPVPGHKIVKNTDEAVIAAERIGYPVAMKIVSPQVVHKSRNNTGSWSPPGYGRSG